MRVVIAGGGTAGHVNPAIALGLALGSASITFIGTKVGSEATLVPQAGFSLETIEVKGWDRSRPWSLVSVGIGALGAIRTAKAILRRLTPDVVVGMGGYVALPVCMAARFLRVPVVIHEQNIVLGLTNRLCRRFARKVAVSFEETLDQAGGRAVNTGNPVLPEISSMDHDVERKNALERYHLDPARKTLLVFGGSQGAKRINDAVAGLVDIWAERSDRQVLHIAGSAQSSSVGTPITETGLVYRPVRFVARMEEPYAVADLALCRGGATTVAELGAAGVPALIVPYPFHRDKQQERHGRLLERVGAARVIADSETTGERVASEADNLLADEVRLLAMRAAAHSFGRPQAAEALARVVREVAA